MQKPTIGRIVTVLAAAHPGNNGADVAPAIVTRVWSDELVNVKVLLDGHHTEWRTSVKLVDDEDAAKKALEVARTEAAERGEITPALPVFAFWPARS